MKKINQILKRQLNRKMVRYINREFMEKEIQMTNKLEECSISLVIKEIKH